MLPLAPRPLGCCCCSRALQIAKAAGYKTIGTCSTGKVDIVKSLGCDVVIDYSKEDVVAKVTEATDGAGVSAVLDGVGADTYEASLAVLGRRGICVFFGNASGPVPPISPLALIGKSAYITRPKVSRAPPPTHTQQQSSPQLRGHRHEQSSRLKLWERWHQWRPSKT